MAASSWTARSKAISLATLLLVCDASAFSTPVRPALLRNAVPLARAAPPLLCAPSQTVWALDFDGVIVDSEPESTRAAWRAALELWPDIMEEAPSIDPREAGVLRKWTGGSWDEMRKDAGDGMPGWLAAKCGSCGRWSRRATRTRC